MRKQLAVVMVALAAVAALVGAADQSTPDRVAFEAAKKLESIDGDLKSAIERYRGVSDGTDRALAAQALVRMAECYQKLGQDEAQKIYERLVSNFGDQPESVALARARIHTAPAPTASAVTLTALPRSDGLPGTVSPDRRFLTFASWEDGELYVRDLRTGADRVLTQRKDFNIGLSAISRDATLVAYQSYTGSCDAREGGSPALCIVSLAQNGTPASKVVVENEDILDIAPMDWSPDGRAIAVSLRRQDRTAQIGVVNWADGKLRVLRSVDWRGPTRIFFSPDGLSLVFDLPVSDTSIDRDIVMMAVDGSQGATVVEHPSQNIVMGWTPDSSQLLFASDRGGTMGLWAQVFSGRQPHGMPRLVRSDLGGAWSLGVTRDGSLYFGTTRRERDISVTTVDLASGKQLTSPSRLVRRFVGTNLFPDWSPDGRYLAYVSERGFNPAGNFGRIIGVRDMTTGVERDVRPKLTYFGAVSWAPDGKSLLTDGTDTKGRPGAFMIDVLTDSVSHLGPGGDSQWSPDGKSVFYRRAKQQSKDFTIVERNLATGVERIVATGELGVFSVSPDGRSIAAHIGRIGDVAAGAVVHIRVDNGEMRELLRAGAAERIPNRIAPQWTPDGHAVLVRKRTPNELWLVPTTGAQPRKLDVDVRDWSRGGVGGFSFHPDGRRIAFLSGSTSNEVMVLENFLVPSTKR